MKSWEALSEAMLESGGYANTNACYTALSVEIIHISDAPLGCRDTSDNAINKWRLEKGKTLQTTLRGLRGVTAVDMELMALGNTSDKIYYEDEGVSRFTAHTTLEKTTGPAVKKLIASICAERELKNTWFSFTEDTYKMLPNTALCMDSVDNMCGDSYNLKSFKMGTLIDLTQFIKHYDSSDRNFFNSKVHVARDDMTAEFLHQRRNVNVKFRVTSGGHNKKCFHNIRYKFEIDYSSIESMVVSTEMDSIKLHINVNHPPILFCVENDLKHNDSSPQKQNKYPKLSLREEYDSYVGVHTDEMSSAVNWIRDNELRGLSAQMIGKCNVFVIEIPINKKAKEFTPNQKCIDIKDPFSVIDSMKRLVPIPVYFAHISEHNSVNNREINYLLDPINMKLPFAVRYAFESIFSHTFQGSDELFFKFETINFMEKCEQYSQTDQKATEETLFQISAIIESRSIFRISIALDKIFDKLKRKHDIYRDRVDMKSFNTEIQEIRRCILTPTRLLLLPPQPILKSRFIVNSEPDYNLRLTIREDNLKALSYTVQRSGSQESQINFVKRIVKTPLMNGITIGDRVFEFLGSSSSQLRDNGMILYAKDNSGRTAHTFRESVGDMSKIRKNVPKYVARLGLVFSQAMTHISIDSQTQIDYFADIEGPFKPDFRNPQILTKERYVFSDGIGMVSEAIAEKVYKQLPNDCIQRPSAMQIRFGGCKGMLVVNPKLKEQRIIFRESMKKYESDDRSLGILKLSAPRPVYLNRPLISLLEQLLVNPNVFLKMLDETLKSLANSLECNASAMALLQNESSLSLPYEKLLANGISFLTEPIFRQILDCLIPHRIRELKSKARIKVPMNRGRIAFGVLDETGSLEYGQIYAKLSHVDKDGIPCGNYFELEGQVMVTKFPCLHPGDVRKLTAVNIPALSHIRDCLVFPAKGARPHSDEMAGSDLDGDEYAIFWNSDLIFKGENIAAMHFPTGKSQELDHKAEVEDILDFYCEYLLSNNVGLIANAYLANADLQEKGIFSPVCMSLAIKYCVALDFAKTGIVEPIDRKEKPKLYPDFMEKVIEKKTYLSKRVLGRMYRMCCEFENSIQSKIIHEINYQPNPKLILPGWHKYEGLATNAFGLYREKITYLLNRCGVANEAVLLSGAFTKTNRYMSGRTEMNDIHELLESLVAHVFIHFRQRFRTESADDSPEDKRLRASAWYMVTYRLNQFETNKFFGFPFTISDELCKIVETSGHQNTTTHPSGWVKSSRKQKPVFLHVNDGSIHKHIQVVIDEDVVQTSVKELYNGCCVRCVGRLVSSPGPKQPVELLCESIDIMGSCDPNTYPIVDKSKDYKLSYFRPYLHLRQRQPMFQSLARIKSETMNAIHMYGKHNDFTNVTTPLLTSNDCEGGGHVFNVRVMIGSLLGDEMGSQSPFCGEDNLYFDRPTYLSVSSQLHLEAMARSLSRVYTLSQCFRAEQSLSRRHLSEFLMFESEEAFVESVDEVMDRVETICKFIAYYISNNCREDLKLIHKETNYKYFDKIANKRYVRMTYNEAIQELRKTKKYADLKSGQNLNAEQERLLVDSMDNCPVFVTHFPANVRPFYMKQSNGEALCFDLLAPISGEICGGSVREDSLTELERRINELNLSESLDWYLDLRRFGNTITGGYGIGFDRLIQTMTGIPNIRDVTAFPRYLHSCLL
ncbi:unnamed protein product [Medioppia subpectinata]|uniref:Aminoacyl-transfer RNA synthetases class-II family profile domain-containing protein n=1 Tax=Medioppia subpectinata TaxID=1979941 RepID=A0A7R9KAW9_9ACAR|nr:unnamed protein product [Medioppia subpectinata]CAG2100088.1 unnamed protein product [Medioppia subpectinata]